jgi:hypothetical protein
LQANGLPHLRILSTKAEMNRAVGAHPGFLLHFSWGVAPGWYELTPLASPEKCPNSNADYKSEMGLTRKSIRNSELPMRARQL